MIKVMWISNKRLDVDKKGGYGGGWLTSLMNNLKKKEDIELHICYVDRRLKELRKSKVDGVWHYGIPRKKHVLKYDKSIESFFAQIIDLVNPDLIHIQGTENANGIAAMNVRPDRTYIVSIQGMIGRYAEHYVAGVPFPFCFDLTLRDLINRDGPISKGKKFAKSSWYENEMVEKASYVMVRTSWDTACVRHINRDAKLYNDLRVLRPSFYKKSWSISQCKKYSIFVGSSQNQIKGLHFILKALPLIIKVFPDTHLYVSSPNFVDAKSFKERLVYQTYYKYIRKLIVENNLKDNVTFMGVLDEEQMCDAFIQANVFVLPSIIENSPNTLSEAAVLGVPTVASYIAGVPDLIENKKNGYLYAYDEYYIMADQVIRIFENDSLAVWFSDNLKKRARDMYNEEKNTNLVYDAYRDIIYNGAKNAKI